MTTDVAIQSSTNNENFESGKKRKYDSNVNLHQKSPNANMSVAPKGNDIAEEARKRKAVHDFNVKNNQSPRNNISKNVDEYKQKLSDAKIVSPKVENDKKTIENLHQSSPMVLKSPSQQDKTKSPMKKFNENSKEMPMNNINASDSKAQSAGTYIIFPFCK